MNHLRLNRYVFLILSGALFVASSGDVQAQGRAKKRKPRKVASWGELGRQIGESPFYEITYFKRVKSDGKVKIRKTKAFLKVTDKSAVYQDVRVDIDQLEPEESVRVFGKPVSRRVPGGRGGIGAGGGVDSQIQNARVVLSGDLENKLPFNAEFVDPKAPAFKWLEGKVKKSGGGLWVTSLGTDSRVTMAQGAPVLKRVKVKPEHVKRRMYVQFFAYTTNERPDTGHKSDAGRDSFRAAMVVILDQGSLTTVYPLMWKR